ncbi:hypothetical protein LguiA_036725 [Lonicera macranthoides]
MGSAECRERNGNNKEGEDGTMMKAPGQNVVSIKREDFENNPKEYFQRIRGTSSINKKEEEDGPMMKAPGQKGVYIKRKDFENNPKDYFRGIRGKQIETIIIIIIIFIITTII